MSISKKLRSTLVLASAVCLMSGGVAWAESVVPDTGAAYSVDSTAAEDNASARDIAGLWKEDGPEERLLAIHRDGTYELMDKTGDGTYYGTVKVIFEEYIDGSRVPLYNLYTSDGTLWMGFPKNKDEGIQSELWSGQDGAVHFVRRLENDYDRTSEGVDEDSYPGVWGCGRVTVVISKEDRGYLATVKWANSAADGSTWTYPCVYDDYSAILVCSGNGVREDYAFTDSGEESSEERYNDGTGTFVMREGVLTWQDNKENAGESIEFRK